MLRSSRKSASNSAYGLWSIVLLLIAGSFCLTLVQLSKGLHEQLMETKHKLYEARKELVLVSMQKQEMLDEQQQQRSKVIKLREKSALISKEVLEQQKRVKLLQYEILATRQDLKGMTVNCTESSQLMEKQFNVTMRFLMDRVINNRQYHILLNKNLKDRVMLERSLELMQNKVYNLTEQMSLAKANLLRASQSISQTKSDVDECKSRLIKSNEALTKTTSLLEQERKKCGFKSSKS